MLTVFALFLVAGFNHTAFYPSTFDLQSSLTIGNSSSSRYTLTADELCVAVRSRGPRVYLLYLAGDQQEKDGC
ncbi:MAG: cytochrome d ubiquinol oxidase subunit II [Marinilabiliales bacterium]|nr:cytochrome d ubiquinol oxidase subunit II [Marinilabiliales bacterium]